MAAPLQNNTSAPANTQPRLSARPGLVLGVILVTALLAFEIFNYSTTDFALRDLLGELRFMGLRWATVLAIAFCGIDFAGIARLFTPQQDSAHTGNWFLFTAWLLAASMNAALTWWGVSLAMLNRQNNGSAVLSQATILYAGPIFIAILVWLIRVLIIGAFSMKGDQLFGEPAAQPPAIRQPGRVGQPLYQAMAQPRPVPNPRPNVPKPAAAQPIPHSYANTPRRYTPVPEPAYQDEDEATTPAVTGPVYTKAPLAAKPFAKGERRF